MLSRRTFATVGLGAGCLPLLRLLGCGSAPIEASRIRAVRTSSGGGMDGGYESSELRRQKDGTVTLTTRSREWHNSRETGMDYLLDDSAFERFAEIANEYDLRRASKRRESKLIVYDAPTSRLSYDLIDESGSYDIDNSFSISSQQELTDRDWEGWHAVSLALAELAGANDGVEYMEPINLTVVSNGVQHQFVLNDCAAAESLASMCPIEVSIDDYGGCGKAFHLDETLDVSDAPLATAAAGTICYLASEDEVIIYFADGEPQDSLYELGFVESAYSVEYLADIEPGACNLWSNA